MVLIGMGDESDRARTRFAIGAAIAKLPEADYAIETWPEGALGTEIALGYLFSLYRLFALPHPVRAESPPERAGPSRRRPAGTDRHRRGADPRPDQHARRGYGPEGAGTRRPRSGGTAWRAVTGIHGDSLLDANLPLIHTVGRASDEDPRLIDMTWGEAGHA
jgi:leucyl aminopeptidase